MPVHRSSAAPLHTQPFSVPRRVSLVVLGDLVQFSVVRAPLDQAVNVNPSIPKSIHSARIAIPLSQVGHPVLTVLNAYPNP